MSSNIFLWNLQKSVTGTEVAPDKAALDVNIASGTITSENPSVGPTGDPVPAEATLIGGENPDGDLQAIDITAAGAVKVDGSGVTQPVSAASLPLPAGASTEATLSALNAKVAACDTDNVTVASSALPTGAATAANQDTANASLSSIDGKTPALVSGRVPVDGSGVTQPVSAASLPLPTGAATEATLSAASAKLPATLGQKTMAASMAVVLASDQSSIPVSSAVPAALTVKSAGISVGTSAVRLTTDGSAPSSTRRVLMANVDTAVTAKFYIGPSGVTAANGVLLVAGQTFNAENDAGDYYIISNTAGQTVFVTEQE